MTTAEWVLLGMFFGACAWAGCLWAALLREQRLCDEYRGRLKAMIAWYGKGKADDSWQVTSRRRRDDDRD